MSKRAYKQPNKCLSCEFYYACVGGCMRDYINYNGYLYGHFFFCKGWKGLFNLFKKYEAEKDIEFLQERLNRQLIVTYSLHYLIYYLTLILI